MLYQQQQQKKKQMVSKLKNNWVIDKIKITIKI